MRYSHIVDAFKGQAWFLEEQKLLAIAAVLEIKAAGGDIPAEEVAAVVRAADRGAQASGPSSIAVLPLLGTIAQRAGMMSEMSGGTSTEKYTQAFRQVMADDSVKAVILDVDSPGGSVYGVDELATEIYNARGKKPIVAVANSLMASAAYYIGSAADELIVTPGGEVGSIGCVMVHEDWSGAYEQAGVKPTIIKAGKYKWEGNDTAPLSEEAQSAFQSQVDRYYDMFVRSVARGRKTSISAVRSGFGEGRVVGASEAIASNMADGRGTLDQVIAILASGRKKVAGALAEFDMPAVIAEEETPRIEQSEEPPVRVDRDRLRRLALGV